MTALELQAANVAEARQRCLDEIARCNSTRFVGATEQDFASGRLANELLKTLGA